MTGCSFIQNFIGPLQKIIGRMDRFKYRDIMRDVMEFFMHDNDSKIRPKLFKISGSADLNSIENIWSLLKYQSIIYGIYYNIFTHRAGNFSNFVSCP